jgi:hypothetical protein
VLLVLLVFAHSLYFGLVYVKRAPATITAADIDLYIQQISCTTNSYQIQQIIPGLVVLN